MRRRTFITLLGGAAAAWPVAQGERMRRIGVLLPAAPDDAEFQSWVGAFLQGLAQSGWITGRNVRIETRWTKFDTRQISRPSDPRDLGEIFHNVPLETFAAQKHFSFLR
jgi:hypothetical protein